MSKSPHSNPQAAPRADSRTSGDAAPDARFTSLVTDWAAAIVANDPVRIASFMADEWVIVSESGVASKEQFLRLVESGELTHSAMAPVTRPRVRVYGDTAVVTARATNTAHYQGARYDADEWTTDVFVRRDGRWLCVLSHITPVAPDA
ncbi:nuclear transport factor 2 family protein [Streptomyces apocyni]|uniref:nuclear transport factor 2 family protein n=1 Tax=Streptomyces apocyni TaxID=2654677 RepID=UPI0012E992E9|nr:nuclear transport factor 2 family protein [Streptomyces apocyni]